MPLVTDLEYILQITKDALEEIQDEITGQIVNTSQAIVDVWEIDCEGDWILYVKTATIAAGAALYLLLTPSLEEILESYLEPKPGRRHGRRGQRGDRGRRENRLGQRRLFFRPPIPDIDNAIADAIPGRSLLAGRRVGPGEHIFWTGVQVADTFLWYWLLIEATETFATRWQSEIIKSGQCNALQDGYFQASTPQQTPFNQNALWFDKNTLIGLKEDNLNVLNNGAVELIVANSEAHALIICLGQFAVTNNDLTRTGVWEVGVHAVCFDSQGQQIEERESTVRISAGPGQSASAVADIGFLVEGVHQVTYNFLGTTIQAANWSSFTAEARAAMQTRDIHLV